MKPKDIHKAVNEAIQKRPPSNRDYYHFCWWQEGLRCMPCLHTDKTHPILLLAPVDVLEKGLTPFQVKLIEERLQKTAQSRGAVQEAS
ncbi:MAG: hypothetical protein KBE04_13750 [Phycisphaerae bacterium]|nr:hypothetical protein [Phycisphaerae bacterium]